MRGGPVVALDLGEEGVEIVAGLADLAESGNEGGLVRVEPFQVFHQRRDAASVRAHLRLQRVPLRRCLARLPLQPLVRFRHLRPPLQPK